MKNALLYITTLFFISISNAAASNTSLSINYESLDEGYATSVGMFSNTDKIFYGGLSLNHINLSTVIQSNNRTTIYPLYFIIGVKAPWKISPYIEFGADLPETIFDEYIQKNEDEDPRNEIDYFFSGGVSLSFSDKFSLVLYAKRYNFIFRENYLAPLNTVSVTSYGAGLTFHF